MNSNKYAAFGNDISSLSIISCEWPGDHVAVI